MEPFGKIDWRTEGDCLLQKKNRTVIRLLATSVTIASLTAGCQSAPSAQAPPAPATIPPKTLTAFTQFVGYVYIGGQWKVLSAAATHNTPSSPFAGIQYSPSGMLTAKTVGSDHNSFVGNQIELWMYDKAWKQVEINGNKTIAKYAWSPSNMLYAASDDGQTPGVWSESPGSGNWTQVPGSVQFGFINSIQFSPTGRLTITYQSPDGSSAIAQYDNGSWNRLTNNQVPFASDGIQLKWSPKGVLTIGTSQHGVWENTNGSWKRPGGIKSPIKEVTQLGWSPAGKLVISGDTSHSKGLWKLSNGKWTRVGGPHATVAHHGIREFGWSPSGVLTVSDNSTAEIDQFLSGKWTVIRKSPRSTHGPAPTFKWSPSGVLTSDGGADGGLWSYKNGKWSEVGGASTPIHGNQSVLFAWS